MILVQEPPLEGPWKFEQKSDEDDYLEESAPLLHKF